MVHICENNELPCERELKVRLACESDWAKVALALGGAGLTKRQVNYYFDTADRELSRRRCMLRIREVGGACVLTYKRGLALDGGFFQAVEIEAAVNQSLLAGLEEGAALAASSVLEASEPFQQMRRDGVVGALLYQGAMVNERQVFGLDGGEKLELDRTDFGAGRVDYEIEMETPNREGALNFVQRLCARADVAFSLQGETKYERFLRWRGLEVDA